MSELDQYDYDLPRDLIAQYPLPRRQDARLMVVRRRASTIEHRLVRDLPEYLDRDDCLILNDTRVIPARLRGHRLETSGAWEGLFLNLDSQRHWQVLCKSRGKLKPGEPVMLQDPTGQDVSRLWLLEKQPGGVWLAHPDSDEDPFELLERIGTVPLPPYIRGGKMMPSDRDRYQTVFAKAPGSAAAPTAGLHFTERLLSEIRDQGVDVGYVTLHVGLDTFQPVRVDNLDLHRMHREWGQLRGDTAKRINQRRATGGRLIAVGTTATRVLETAASDTGLDAWEGSTDLFIRPGYQFQAIDGLLTNFHLPRSTLLVLVRTFGGDALMRRAYEQAIQHQYRFFSYGDAMLIL
jgi:S-adenosylmethionine:tRNA ribosyltransferase-isomerase